MKASTIQTIHALVAQADCTVHFSLRDWRGSCVRYPNLDDDLRIDLSALVPRPDNTVNALAVLHELGHVATMDQHDLPRACREVGGEERLEWEARAWEWAVENYPERVSVRGWSFILHCLSTYRALSFGSYGPAFRRIYEMAKVESKGRTFAA